MHSRLTNSARLASRVSAASLKAARPSPALFAHHPVASASQSSFRLFSSTRFLAEEPKSTLETLSTSQPTESEAATKADSAESPLAPEELASSSAPAPVDADAAAKAEEQARTVFVGGLSWNVDGEWLQDELLKALEIAEGVESVRIARNPMGKSRGFGFVVFDKPELALAASKLTLEIDSRSSEVRLADDASARPERPPRTSSPFNSTRNPPSNTVFLGNIPWSATPELLEDLMMPFGAIKRISLPTDSETGRSRGIAYIEFDGPGAREVVAESLEGKGFEMDGRSLMVDFAAEKSNSPRGPPRSGARGGFGGGRGGGRGGSSGGRGGGYSGGRGGSSGAGGYGQRREGGGGRDRDSRPSPRDRWD